MSRGVLITGTDTGVGKTMVSCAVVAALHARGLDVAVYKPVETGCSANQGRLEAADATKLVAAAGGRQAGESATGYRFALAAAPLVAAEAAREPIDPQRLTSDLRRLAADHEIVVVEGAGGLLVPIAERYTYLELARDLALGVVCVVGSRLGCINHALLTLSVLESARVSMHGFVTNQLEAGDVARDFAQSNRRTIGRFTQQRDLGLFPHVESPVHGDYAALGRIAERALVLDVIA
jgi:dethiobiotin synthetase